MRRVGRSSGRKGAVRIEYVIAAVICAMLLTGMSAVLYVRSVRMTANAVRQPIVRPTHAEPDEVSLPRTGTNSNSTVVKPNPQPAKPTRNEPAETEVIVITTDDTPAPTQTQTGSRGYPDGEAHRVSASSATRIEAQDYDLGGEGVAYHDTTSTNEGKAYRLNEGVDVLASLDSQGEYAVGWIRKGEWLNYTLNVAKAGTYRMKVREATTFAGKARITLNGVSKGEEIAIPATGGNYAYATFEVGNVELSAGTQVMRLEALSDDWSINWIELEPISGSGTTVVEVPEVIVTTDGAGGNQANQQVSDLPLLAQDNFEDGKVNGRPVGDLWEFDGVGSATIQATPGETNQKCLRLVDSKSTGNILAGRRFDGPAKEKLVWAGRIRFNASAEQVGISLLEKDKPAVLLYTRSGSFGFENSSGNFTVLDKFEPNTWYDLRVEANVKGGSANITFGTTTRKDLKFRNGVGEINTWIAGTGGSTIGIFYVDNVGVYGK